MTTIKFSDFMAQKHHILGLTQQEQHYSDIFKYLFYILVAVVMLAIPVPAPITGVVDAFLYK